MKALPPRFLKLKLAAFLIGAISLTGCGDDGLGSSFQASDRPDEEEELGPKSPLEPGTEYWFAVNWSFKRTTQTDDSGATQGEAQSVGHVCLEIDSLKGHSYLRIQGSQRNARDCPRESNRSSRIGQLRFQ